MKDEAQTYLRQLSEQLPDGTTVAEHAVKVGANPANLILKYSQQHGIDLIAVATHGRRGIARLLLGSVADKLIRGASVPVLVHRPTRDL